MFYRLFFLLFLVATPIWALAQVPINGDEPGGAPGDVAGFQIWSANDMYYIPLKTDKYYSAGMGAIYTRYQNKERKGERVRAERGWGIRQDIFTPRNIENPSLLLRDRPFASYSVLEHHRATELSQGWSLRQRYSVGVLGKYSGGAEAQNAVHRMVNFAEELDGWKNQVESDLVLNYRLQLTKRMSLSDRFWLLASGAAQVGTLHTDAGLRFGGHFSIVDHSPTKYLKFSATGEARYVAYNATLTGGLLNRDDRYRGVVQTQRWVRRTEAKFEARYNWLGGQVGINYLSKEFRDGGNHVFVVAGLGVYW
ncbi:lipid A-modifier LpxR family protein [Lewinella sp. 4G2]|uniref:lipid A-modifier LpxR family protein n=1 Tax=Lewinella sp. 4G2 TaxID=1803372 RepID=UPI0007B489ED|nr:lipid A-modifier LpxR family protein [Lewinella sp. 4G2]OAV43399.1 hypothetical protein A3850_002305 [Lewinella sp. 4G2]